MVSRRDILVRRLWGFWMGWKEVSMFIYLCVLCRLFVVYISIYLYIYIAICLVRWCCVVLCCVMSCCVMSQRLVVNLAWWF